MTLSAKNLIHFSNIDLSFSSFFPHFYGILFLLFIITIILIMQKNFNSRRFAFDASLLGVLVFGVSSFMMLYQFPEFSLVLFNRMFVADGLWFFLNVMLSVVGFGSIIFSRSYLQKHQLDMPEYYVLILFSMIGMSMFGGSLDLIALFISLELLSLPLYGLVAFRRNHPESNEASLKYFILGSVASAFFLYGVAFLYGYCGSTQLDVIYQYFLHASDNILGWIGVAFIMTGLLFKCGVVPFHMWVADVYQGTISPVIGWMSAAVKIASFGFMMRLFMFLGLNFKDAVYIRPGIKTIFLSSIFGLALLSMLVGNVLAIRQKNIKRLLAYSSIAHSGYLLSAYPAMLYGIESQSAVLVYLFIYGIVTFGAFAVVSFLSEAIPEGLTLEHFSGLAHQYPLLSLFFSIFLLSMAGMPPTAGFFAKYTIFLGLVKSGYAYFVVCSLCISAIAFYYYLKPIFFMYMKPAHSTLQIHLGFLDKCFLILTGSCIFFLGINPNFLQKYATQVVSVLFKK